MKKLIFFFFQDLIFYKKDINQRNLVIYNDTIGQQILTDGFYEKSLVDNILNSFDFDSSKTVCVDVGSNIGNHIVQFSAKFSHCFGFEPQLRTFRILELNTEYIQNITVFNYGLSELNQKVDFKIPISHTGGASFNLNLNENFYKEEVDLRNFDEMLIDEISYIKIDVEGNEFDVINSMKNSIMKSKPVISVEISGDKLERQRIIDFLSCFNYDKYYIPKKHFSDSLNAPSFIKYPIKFLLKAFFPLKNNCLQQINKKEIFKHEFIQLLTITAEDSKFKIKNN